MIYRPRVPSLFDRADAFEPRNRDLRGLWCFAGSRHARDFSPYANDAATYVNPTWTERGLQLNDNGHIDVGDQPQYRYDDSISAGFTYEAIFTADQFVNGEYPRIFSKMSGSPYNAYDPSGATGKSGYELMITAPDDAVFSGFQNKILFQLGQGTATGQHWGANITAGRRHHCIVTKRPGVRADIYVDGILNNTGVFGTLTGVATSESLKIGTSGATTDGIRGSIEKIALYGRELSYADVQRMFNDPYWHFSTRKLFLFGGGSAPVTPFFDWDFSPECSWELAAQTGEFSCDGSLECTWDAPQASTFLTCDVSPGAEFTGHVGAVGRFDASVDMSAEFSGRVRGAVAFEADLSLQCSWIVGAAIVKKDCIAGDGRFGEVSGDIDLEQNYVF
jgi:hypothetical protein